MTKKKISLSLQYFLGIFPFFYILFMASVSKYNLLPIKYSSIVSTIGYLLFFIIIIIELRPKETADEYAIKTLAKVDRICMTFVKIVLMILLVFIGSPNLKGIALSRDDISVLLCLVLVGITTLKAILFYIYNRRGL